MHIHLIAVCGTGMGSLAGMLKAAGHVVTGSDRNIYPPMSIWLAEQGIPVMDGFSAEHLNPRPDLVVIGNAVRRENPEAQAAIEAGIEYHSFPAALQRFFLTGRATIAVCGTHGKTTTTALLAHLMTAAGWDPSFLVGGICRNFGSPIRLGGGPHFVIEGDEYDTAFFDKVPKFVRYKPSHAILANVEFDHADIYPDFASVYAAFEMLVDGMPADGLLIAGADCPNVRRLIAKSPCRTTTYATGAEADFTAADAVIDGETMSFRIRAKDRDEGAFVSPIVGDHNLKNVLAAYAAAREFGMSNEVFRVGLKSFLGVKRRQEIRGEADGVVVIDDFAHHPTAVRVTLETLARQWTPRRVVAIFEPRTNTSRRNYFQKEYAESFDAARAVVLAPVHDPDALPADQRLDPAKLAEDIGTRGILVRRAADYDEVLRLALEVLRPGDVAAVLSNGGFGGMHERLISALTERKSVR